MVELKIHLIRLQMKQTELARRLGISTRYMSDIVLGKRKAPSIRKRMIDEFGLPAKIVAIDSRPTKRIVPRPQGKTA